MSTTAWVAIVLVVMFIAYRMKVNIKLDLGELTAQDKQFSKSASHAALEVLGCSVDPTVDSPKEAQKAGYLAVQEGGINYAATVSLIALGIAANYVQNKNKSEAGLANLMSHLSNLIADEFGFSHDELWDLRGAITKEDMNAGFLFQQAAQKAFGLYGEASRGDVLKRVVLAVATRNQEIVV